MPTPEELEELTVTLPRTLWENVVIVVLDEGGWGPLADRIGKQISPPAEEDVEWEQTMIDLGPESL